MKCYASGPDNQKESVVPCCLWSQHAVASCFEVFQLLQQFPDAFEFSSSILLRLAEEVRFSKNQLGKMRKKWQRYQNTLNLICTTIQMQFTVYMCIVYQKKKIQFQFQVCFARSPTQKKGEESSFPNAPYLPPVVESRSLPIATAPSFVTMSSLTARFKQPSHGWQLSTACWGKREELSSRILYPCGLLCSSQRCDNKKKMLQTDWNQKQSHAMSQELESWCNPGYKAHLCIFAGHISLSRWSTREGSESSTFPQLVPSELRDLGGVVERHDLIFANHQWNFTGHHSCLALNATLQPAWSHWIHVNHRTKEAYWFRFNVRGEAFQSESPWRGESSPKSQAPLEIPEAHLKTYSWQTYT